MLNSFKKLITSALVISGATALTTMEAEATETRDTVWSEEEKEETDLQEMEVIEKVLRHYANPLHRINYQLEEKYRENRIIYEVKEGDTLSGISVQFGIPVSEIIEENNIRNKHRISIGQKLHMRVKEQSYMVQHGETLKDIAISTGVTMEEIVAYNSILMHTNYSTYPGQELNIPTAPAEPIHQPLSTPKYNSPQKSKVVIASRSEEKRTTTESLSELSFTWPVIGKITSTFGTRWGRMHNGIDIAHTDRSNAPIVAAQSGVVIDAYYHRGGYGNLVIVDHGNGLQTYYAHLSKIEVYEGKQIEQGELVGYMGRTGNATGYHLHFEIRANNRPLNPLQYLPK